ncbi:MAG: hypothetical protein EU529_13640 [Promethearchaeota archaeon]|nr:MAG: hypothetical protein EU529_13640 [Candidatus Lokiarchaeota archaeon]
MDRPIENRELLNYLFQSLSVGDLKQYCKELSLKGYSKLNKDALVDFILDSMSEEELENLLQEKELSIISKSIDVALNKINKLDRESIREIRIANEEEHEVEIDFVGPRWESSSFISISPENIDEPERDCDCRVGSKMGFCNHFWIGFIFSLKKGYFELKDWKLTQLPENFKENIKNIEIEEINGRFNLINKEPDNPLLTLLDKKVSVHEGVIQTINKRTSDFQGNITVYYMTTLINVKIGPFVKKKDDLKEENIISIDEMKLRISEKAYNAVNPKKGDNLSCNGTLVKDNFIGIMMKRVSGINTGKGDTEQNPVLYYLGERITVYESEITEMEKKEYKFRGDYDTVYYLTSLKDVRFGPQLKKKSEYDENKIENINELKMRISENIYDKLGPKIGDKISCNGTVDNDSFFGTILKRVAKFTKL